MLGWIIYDFVPRSTIENWQDTPFVLGSAAVPDLHVVFFPQTKSFSFPFRKKLHSDLSDIISVHVSIHLQYRCTSAGNIGL